MKTKLIKIDYKELVSKSTEELKEMLKEMKLHITRAYSPMHGGRFVRDKAGQSIPEKGYNPKQERRNMARILQILKERGEKLK
jgi:ribosomal protein L29